VTAQLVQRERGQLDVALTGAEADVQIGKCGPVGAVRPLIGYPGSP
jgi:hypothetical protein